MFEWIKQLNSHSSCYLPCYKNKWTSKSLFPLRPELSFSKNSHCDLDLDHIKLKRKLIWGIVISNTCVKLYWNWIINEGTRAMTMFFLKIATVTLTLALERSNLNLSKILSCITLVWSYSKIGLHIKTLDWRQCFSKNNHCDLDLSPRTLKLKLVQDIIIIKFCTILNQFR